MQVINGKITAATILIVDDDRDIRESLALAINLKGINLSILTAGNATQGLKLATEHKPDIIVLDYNMPLGNGIVLAETIRQTRALKRTKMMMITAQESSKLEWLSVDHDIDAFIRKPFDIVDIEAHIYSLLHTILEGGRRSRTSL